MKPEINDGFWRDKNVFVTGCIGFIGEWLTAALVMKGANVIGLFRDWKPKLSRLWCVYKQITMIKGDVTDRYVLEKALNEYEVSVVFHLAAQSIVSIANQNPMSTFETNIRGTWNLLEACRRIPTVQTIIVASSDKAYGDSAILPYIEEMPLKAHYPYDVSKRCADIIAQSYFVTYNLPCCITRCTNVYGPGDLNFSRLIPGTIRRVIRNEQPIIIGDGTATREYFYVKDCVDAYLRLAEKMEDEHIHGEALNLGGELRLSVSDIIEKILALMDRLDLEPWILNQESGEIKHQYLSTEKARQLLDWTPRYTFEQGLSETIEWYQRYLGEVER